MKKLVGFIVFAAFTFSIALGTANARPPFVKIFGEVYPNVTDAATAKCAICHAGTDKKVRNDYGKALGAALGEANVKDADKVKAAMKKVEESHKEFADKLKAGKLPS